MQNLSDLKRFKRTAELPVTIGRLKKEAKRLSKASPDLKHYEALDMIAVKNGYSCWRSLMANLDPSIKYQRLVNESIVLFLSWDEYSSDFFDSSARLEDWWRCDGSLEKWLIPAFYQEYLDTPKLDVDRYAYGPLEYSWFKKRILGHAIFPKTLITSDEGIEQFVQAVMSHLSHFPIYAIYKGCLVSLYSETSGEIGARVRGMVGMPVDLPPEYEFDDPASQYTRYNYQRGHDYMKWRHQKDRQSLTVFE